MKKISYVKLFGSLLSFLGENKKKFLIWNIPIILATTFSVIEPLIIGNIIDFFTGYTRGDSLNAFYLSLSLLFAGLVLATVFRVTARGAMFEITADLEYDIKTKGFANIQNNSLSWQQNENSGNKVQRIETGTKAYLDLVELIKNDIYRFVISIIGILGIFIAINPLFLIFFAIYTALQLSLFKYWNKKNPQYLARLNSAKELSVGKLFEGLNNIQTIKSLGAALGFQSSIDSSQHELRESTKAYEKLGVYKWISISFLDTVFIVIFFLLVGYNVIAGAISVGFVFVLYTYFGKLQSITGDFTNKFGRLVEVRSNVERMLPLFDSITHNTGTKNFPQDWTTLKLEEIRFVYNLTEDKTVFQNINLTINRGEFVGITGESGSGKSSLLKVLLGLYPISAGTYTIGNTNFQDIKHDEILNSMTVVLQETELFNVSLLENITMFKEVDGKLLEDAVRVAFLEDVISALPDGLDTIVGEKGVRLSGGQRQRIGIARAVYKNSPILLLDEATSNLDYDTEKVIVHNILSLGEKTIIAVAHRLSTIEKATTVYKFENGNLLQI